MRTVIAEYDSLPAAEQAVRALESQIPILNIVIGAQKARRALPLEQQRGGHFVVSMTGTPDTIEHARTLMHEQAASQ